jgi:hypothetical protein
MTTTTQKFAKTVEAKYDKYEDAKLASEGMAKQYPKVRVKRRKDCFSACGYKAVKVESESNSSTEV